MIGLRCIQVKDSWISNCSEPEALIDVQSWLSRLTLDSIGVAGFGHDFHALDRPPKSKSESTTTQSDSDIDLTTILESFYVPKPSKRSVMMAMLLQPLIMLLFKIPSKPGKRIENMTNVIAKVADGIVEKAREGDQGEIGGRSIIETLCMFELAISLGVR